jgi:hypothetical protein
MLRWVAMGALVCGCAGRAEDPAHANGGSAGATTASGAGGRSVTSGSGGSTARGTGGSVTGVGGTAGAASNAPAIEPVGEGQFPLIVRAGSSPSHLDAEADGSFHVVFDGSGAPVDILTHHHYDLTKVFSGISFEVRASEPTALLVATTGPKAQYAEDVSAGYVWRGAEISVSTTFEAHSLLFSEMQALGPGNVRPAADADGCALHFVIPNPGTGEIWLRNIQLRP